MKNTPIIETDRLILRRLVHSDIPDLYSLYRDEEVNTYLPWFPLQSIEETERFFYEKYLNIYSQPQGYSYGICLKNDNVVIGYINASIKNSHDIGYGLSKKYWHQGIITEACKALVKQVKGDGFPYITATHDVNNSRSGDVMKRLGMKYQYSYQELWQPKNLFVTFRMYQLNFVDDADIYREYWDTYDVHFIESGL